MTKRHLLLFVPVLFLCACAKIVPLTGGDKDITPPVMTRTEPDTFSTGFSGKEIRLSFNEYITVDDPTRHVYFSPVLKNAPQFIAGNKSLLIKIKDTLLPNTTYTVRLQGAIKDLNEGNPLDEQLFVFSTGAQIDSGSFSGYVRNAETNEGVKAAKVLLYDAGSDPLRVKTEKPTYYSISRDDGFFTIPYIREGSYKVFALQEEDNSLTYDRAGEGIAFISADITTGQDSSLQLRLFRSADDTLKLLKSKYETEGRFSFKFSKGVPDLQIRAEDSTGLREMLVYSNTNGDSVNVWLRGQPADSTVFYLSARDFSDTVSLKSKAPVTGGGSRGLKTGGTSKPVITLIPPAGKELSLYDTLAVSFSKPVFLRDSSLIVLLEDSVPHPFRLERSPRNPLLWNIFFTPRSDVNYTLDWKRSAFELYSTRDTVDSAHYEFSYLPVEDYSQLNVAVRHADRSAPLIVSLMRDTKVLLTKRLGENDTLISFSKLPPGSYSLKALADQNNDGVYTTGSLPDGRQPEKIYYLASPVVLRKGFDQKIVWDFDKKGR
ncbi:MAG: Ig-like domain-containing protein [Bacteroidia bacterium]|nr:Ig-like domain-containing protein [Bacteroidia bacterium]